MKQSTFIVGLALVILFYFGCFWLLFSNEFVGNDTSFIFQVVVAMMSTGLLAIVTGFMFLFQSQIESRKENRTKIFEKKIEYYNDALDKLDEIFSSGLGDKTSHQMLFLVSKAMLVASPDAADKFAQLYLSVQNREKVVQCFRDFIVAARTDLDLVDRISDGTADSFDPILARLENSIKTESRNLRYWSDEEKIAIIKEYDEIKSNKGAWLKENHGLYYSQIATWKKQLLDQFSDN